MTDIYIGFRASTMPTVKWHGDKLACVLALKNVHACMPVNGVWVGVFTEDIRSDDCQGILEAMRLMGVTKVKPVGRSRAATERIEFVVNAYGSRLTPVRPRDPISSTDEDIGEWFNAWVLFRSLQEKLQ